MVPTMILFGLLLGRWWKVTVPLAAVAWPLIVVASGVDLSGWEVIVAAALGLINAAVGAAVYLAVVGQVRLVRAR